MPLILLAEDEAPTVDHVRSVLASQGWLVKTVGSRDQALRAASEFAPQLVLVNDKIAGVADLVRTFSRRSGGPGVVLLSAEANGVESTSHDAQDVEAVLKKPLETEDLITTVRDRLAEGQQQKASAPLGVSKKLLTSKEIFGDLLDDILDPDDDVTKPPAAARPSTPEAAAEESQPQSVAEEPAAVVTAGEEEADAAVDEPVAVAADAVSDDEMADLEDMVREEVGAWAEGVDSEDEESEAEVEIENEVAALEVAEPPVVIEVEDEEEEEIEIRPEDLDLKPVHDPFDPVSDLAEPPTPVSLEPEVDEIDELTDALVYEAEEDSRVFEPPVAEEDLDSRLEDTLAGVLADSLTQADAPESDDVADVSVDALLSSALGDLNLGPTKLNTTSMPVSESASEPVESDEVAVEAPEASAVDGDSDLEPLSTSETIAEEEPVVEPPSPTAESTGEEFGDYTLEKRIGLGGMAEVWKARRKGVEGFQKRVAIKKILPQAAENEAFVEMFIDEAKLAAQLNHNNIIHIYDLGRMGEDYYIAMEYVDGKNLRQILTAGRKTDQPMPEGIALHIASRLADALDYAHRSKDLNDADLGLVHRDVSPQNVLISLDGDIKLCDFGIAKAVSKMSTTQMGALKGKLQYMSPEQAWGKSIDHRSDIFSLGSLLYEMITGERLFAGDSEISVLETVRECDVAGRIIQSTDISAGVKGLLLRALAREPESRFDSAGELQAGLEEILAEQAPSPSQKELAAYLRSVLGEPSGLEVDTGQDPATPLGPEGEAVLSDIGEAEWIGEPSDLDIPGETEEERRKQAWVKKLLTRLLPVILLLGALGGILGYAWYQQGASEAAPTESSARAPTVEAAPSVDPATPSSTTPTVTPDPSSEEPATEDLGGDEPAQASPVQTGGATAPAAADSSATAAAQPPAEASNVPTIPAAQAVDPELDQRVEQDLQRVQELIATSPFEGDDSADTDPAPAESPPRLIAFDRPDAVSASDEDQPEGTVRVSVLVDESGRVVDTLLVEGMPQVPGLDDAVLQAARQATFEPGTRNGQPTRMWYEMQIQYER